MTIGHRQTSLKDRTVEPLNSIHSEVELHEVLRVRSRNCHTALQQSTVARLLWRDGYHREVAVKWRFKLKYATHVVHTANHR